MEFIKVAKSFRFSPKPNVLSRNIDFFSDRLFHTHTNRLLLVFIILSTFRRLFSSPITCWVPVELKRYEKYMSRYCWIKGTYYVNQSYDLNTFAIEARDESLLHYYQWVYFFLIIQAFLFYLPRILWCFISQKILDYDLYNMVDAAIKHDLYAYDPNTILQYLSSNFNHHFNYLPRKYYKRYAFVSNKLNNNATALDGSIVDNRELSCLNKFTRNFEKISLTLTYIMIKIIFLVIALLQIYAMNAFLSNKAYAFYGNL